MASGPHLIKLSNFWHLRGKGCQNDRITQEGVEWIKSLNPPFETNLIWGQEPVVSNVAVGLFFFFFPFPDLIYSTQTNKTSRMSYNIFSFTHLKSCSFSYYNILWTLQIYIGNIRITKINKRLKNTGRVLRLHLRQSLPLQHCREGQGQLSKQDLYTGLNPEIKVKSINTDNFN